MNIKQEIELYRALRTEYATKPFSIYDVSALINTKLPDVFNIDSTLTQTEPDGPFPTSASFTGTTDSTVNKSVRSKLQSRVKPIRTFLDNLVQTDFLKTQTEVKNQLKYHFVEAADLVDAKEMIPLLFLRSFSNLLFSSESRFKSWFNDTTVDFDHDVSIVAEDLFEKFGKKLIVSSFSIFRPFESQHHHVFQTLVEALTDLDRRTVPTLYICQTLFSEFEGYPETISIEHSGFYVYFVTREGSIQKVPFFDINRLTDTGKQIEVFHLDTHEQIEKMILHPLSGVAIIEDYDLQDSVAITVTEEVAYAWSALGLISMNGIDYVMNDDGTITYQFDYDENDATFAQFLSNYVTGIRSISSDSLKSKVKDLLTQTLQAW